MTHEEFMAWGRKHAAIVREGKQKWESYNSPNGVSLEYEFAYGSPMLSFNMLNESEITMELRFVLDDSAVTHEDLLAFCVVIGIPIDRRVHLS
jgi:hypothetical protein